MDPKNLDQPMKKLLGVIQNTSNYQVLLSIYGVVWVCQQSRNGYMKYVKQNTDSLIVV